MLEVTSKDDEIHRSGLFDSGVENDELSAVAKIPIGLMLLLSSYTSEFHPLRIVVFITLFATICWEGFCCKKHGGK